MVVHAGLGVAMVGFALAGATAVAAVVVVSDMVAVAVHLDNFGLVALVAAANHLSDSRVEDLGGMDNSSYDVLDSYS